MSGDGRQKEKGLIVRLSLCLVVLTAFIGIFAETEALAQQAVPPRWNWQGSAVCPNGFDYYAGEGLCISRGYAYGRRGYGGGYFVGGQGIPPSWNRRGSAVCPDGYDFHAHVGLCLPQ